MVGPAVLLLAGCSAVNPWARTPASNEAIATLSDFESSATQRTAAARRLASSGLSADIASLKQALQSDDPESVRLSLAGIAHEPVADPRLLPYIEPHLQTPELAPLACAAISSIRTPAAASTLLRHLELAPHDRPDVAAAALARLTGSDLGRDPDRWSAWLAASADSEQLWSDAIIAGLAARSDALGASSATRTQLLADVYTRLHEATSPDQRPLVLIEMITSADPEVRTGGINLIERQIAGGSPIDPRVGPAAISLLSDDQALTRIDAARLLDTLAPDGAGEALAEALQTEQIPEVATAMLRAAGRYPQRDLAPAVTRWLVTAIDRPEIESGELLRNAEQATLALAEADAITPADQRTLAEELRDHAITERSPAGIRLIAIIGNDNDRNRISRLLQTSDEQTLPARRAAARALTPHGEYLVRIIRAARREPELFEIAVDAVVQHQQSRAGYRTISSLVAPDSASMNRAKATLAQTLPLAQLLQVASDEPDATFRDGILGRVLALVQLEQDLSDAERGTLIDCLVLLAETRLEILRVEPALAAAGAALAIDPDNERAFRARVVSQILLMQIDDAVSVEAPADVWFRALELMEDRPGQTEVAAIIQTRFESELTDAQRQRLQAIAERRRTEGDG